MSFSHTKTKPRHVSIHSSSVLTASQLLSVGARRWEESVVIGPIGLRFSGLCTTPVRHRTACRASLPLGGVRAGSLILRAPGDRACRPASAGAAQRIGGPLAEIGQTSWEALHGVRLYEAIYLQLHRERTLEKPRHAHGRRSCHWDLGAYSGNGIGDNPLLKRGADFSFYRNRSAREPLRYPPRWCAGTLTMSAVH